MKRPEPPAFASTSFHTWTDEQWAEYRAYQKTDDSWLRHTPLWAYITSPIVLCLGVFITGHTVAFVGNGLLNFVTNFSPTTDIY